jgi:hypothetical protein
MSIWGRRDGEPPAEEHQGQAAANDGQAAANDGQAAANDARPAAAHQAGEPAPAFWRAQGETPESLGRDPADAPPPAYEHMPAGAPPPQAPPAGPSAPAVSEAPAGTDAPVPVLTGVVIDGETPVKDPAPTETPGEQAETHDAQADPVAAEVQVPTVAGAHEPAAGAQEPAAGAQESAAADPGQPAAATITPQRWSEILVAFVDDPHASVKMAADTVDEAIDEFVNSVRVRQRELASSWQGTETGTEQLRTALRDYRKFWYQVQRLDLGEKTGA